MTATIIYVAFFGFLAFVIKYSDRDTRWWWGFILFFGLLAKFGLELNFISLLVAMGVWKFLKDVCNGCK